MPIPGGFFTRAAPDGPSEAPSSLEAASKALTRLASILQLLLFTTFFLGTENFGRDLFVARKTLLTSVRLSWHYYLDDYKIVNISTLAQLGEKRIKTFFLIGVFGQLPVLIVEADQL